MPNAARTPSSHCQPLPDVEHLGAYYIIDFSIYQTPDFYALIGNRILGSLYYTQKALELAQEEIGSHPDLEYDRDSTRDLFSTMGSGEGDVDDESSHMEKDLEQIDSLEQPAIRALRLHNTAAVQSGYDKIIHTITATMLRRNFGEKPDPQ